MLCPAPGFVGFNIVAELFVNIRKPKPKPVPTCLIALEFLIWNRPDYALYEEHCPTLLLNDFVAYGGGRS